MNGAVDLRRPGKLRCNELFADSRSGPATDAGQVQSVTGAELGSFTRGNGIAKAVTIFVIHTPIGSRFRSENGIRIRPMHVEHLSPCFTGNLFERPDQRFDDLLFGLYFQACRSRGPCSVAAEGMLFRRWDIAFGPIRQLDIEVTAGRTTTTQLETGQCIDFIGKRGDGEVADANRLQLNIRSLAFMQN